MCSPRFARRLICIQFWGQKRIGGFAKYGSSRCFSEMLAIRKDYSRQSISRLDLRILRTHEPVRAKTALLFQSRLFSRSTTLFETANFAFWRRILLWIKRRLNIYPTAFEVLFQFVLIAP